MAEYFAAWHLSRHGNGALVRTEWEAEKTGLAAETLCRLETGALTNPTYRTLGLYAAAVGRRLVLTAEA